MQSSTLYQDLLSLLGEKAVSIEKKDLEEHSIDRWFASHPPEVVVFAESSKMISRLLKYCHENSIPVTPRGAGVGYVGGAVPVEGGVSLSLARMNQIKEINPADGVAVVEPGVITADLAEAAEKVGFFYPPDPASLKECSIGGNIATNAGGPRCLKYGVTRHYVLGLEVVLANGEILQTGSRCHKNKTGFDLVSLFVGSEGMLGIVTEATLRLIPAPLHRGMLACGFADFAKAAQCVEKIFASNHLPSALEITDEFTLSAARSYLKEDIFPGAKSQLMLEVDGTATAVKDELSELCLLVSTAGGSSLEVATNEKTCESFWDRRREFSYSLRATEAEGLTKLNEDIVVPRSKLTELAAFATEIQKETGIRTACFGHAGDGNLHVNLMVQDYDDPQQQKAARNALDQLFTQVIAWGGMISGEHGIGLAKKPWLAQNLSEQSMQTHRDLKKALDPKGILNPGKFLS